MIAVTLLQKIFTGLVSNIDYNASWQQVFFIDDNASGNNTQRYTSTDPKDDS